MKIAKMVKVSRAVLVVMCLFVFGMMAMADGSAASAAGGEAVAAAEQVSAGSSFAMGCKYIGIAVMMVGGSFAAAWAVGKIGAAAMGASVERPELLGKAIALVGLGEGIALFGFLISLMLLNK